MVNINYINYIDSKYSSLNKQDIIKDKNIIINQIIRNRVYNLDKLLLI